MNQIPVVPFTLFSCSGGALMAKNRKLLFLTIAVLFQIFFLYQAVFNYHVYTLDPAFCSFAEDFQSDAFSGGYTGALFYRGTAFPVRPLLIVCLCGCIGTRTFLGKAGFRRSGSFPPVPGPYVFVPPVFLPLPPVYGADRHRRSCLCTCFFRFCSLPCSKRRKWPCRKSFL